MRESPATRRRERTKRKHMQECGEVRYLTAEDGLDAWCTLQTLMQQKSRSFAHKGIPDVFAPAGHREFFIDLAGDANLRGFVHVSRVEIGG